MARHADGTLRRSFFDFLPGARGTLNLRRSKSQITRVCAKGLSNAFSIDKDAEITLEIDPEH